MTRFVLFDLNSLFVKQTKCKSLRKTASQAATLLAHARELLDDQRHQRGLGSGTNGAPAGAPKQTMQTEIRWEKISVLMELPVLQFHGFFHPPSSIIHLKKQNKKDISRIIPFYLIVHALVVS